MTGSALQSCASTEIRSLSRLLLFAAPASLLLAVGTWFGQMPRRGLSFAGNGYRDLAPGGATAFTPRWKELEGYSYDRRAEFLAGMRLLLFRLERRHPAPAGDPAAAPLREAQGRMEAELASLGLATDRTWDAAKQEVGVAWLHLRQLCGEPQAPAKE